MQAFPDVEENARTVLEIYDHFRSAPGDVLKANNFIAVAARNHIPLPGLQRGLEHARQLGWIEETPDGSLRLTEKGFEMMVSVSS